MEAPLRVLLGVTGSVAAVKTPNLAIFLTKAGFDVKVVLTKASCHFFPDVARKHCGEEVFKAFEATKVEIYRDSDEWDHYNSVHADPVVHIELSKWADVFLIAPLSANSLAKLSAGLCDNLLTCVARAWDFSKPMLVAPAMNTVMYKHVLTGKQLETLEALGAVVVPPISKKLACGDVGIGAMAAVEDIGASVMQLVKRA